MSRPIEGDPISWMRELVARWLGDDQAGPGLLVRWLQGYGLPPVGHDEEPYLWLLRGIPPGADRDNVEEAFANRVAKLLDEKPDETRLGERPDQLLYNLYHLCAGLQRPDELGERLYAVFTRGKLKGEWRGVDLRYALLGALISNQVDARLLPVWEAMLEGR